MFNLRQLTILMLTVSSVTLAQNFGFNCANALGPCNNICYAVHCKGSAYVLNYDSNAANQGRRLIASGCNRNPCTNAHNSSFDSYCDDFPYPSTKQGGNNAILRCVDRTEYSSEATQLDNFYKSVSNGHQFSIAISNFGGAPFCANAVDCVNDGREFAMVSGKFVNARRTDESSFISAHADSNIGTPFRRFMASDGQERVWLTKNTNDTLVGQFVWDRESGMVLVTSEIPQAS